MLANLKVYWGYFRYVIEHKKNVGIECFKLGLYWHAITHDLSKFLPSEFFPYARKFYGGDYAHKYFQVEDAFAKAWLLHQHRNKHHWDYWVDSEGNAIPMPIKYVKQMIADWRGMSRKFGGTWWKYYCKNSEQMVLHVGTEARIEGEFEKGS